MCGISGILGFADSFAVSEALAREMAASQSHRGPDDEGAWADPAHRVALSHRRLSIIDLSAAGHQPMSNEDGTVWITYNGEVYNHEALRSELEAKGHTLPLAHRHRDDPPPLRGGGTRLRRQAGRHVRIRHLGRAPAPAAARPRPPRRQAAALRAAAPGPRVRLGGAGDPASIPRCTPSSTRTRSTTT